VAWLFFSAL
jgi:hypothetical protein